MIVSFVTPQDEQIGIDSDAVVSVRAADDSRFTVLGLVTGAEFTVRGRAEQTIAVLNQKAA